MKREALAVRTFSAPRLSGCALRTAGNALGTPNFTLACLLFFCFFGTALKRSIAA